ncbi:MAG: c-type cytochrome [Anderseniella sp.]|nr:c-type cytochrome [Anderseniella sp.]
MAADRVFQTLSCRPLKVRFVWIGLAAIITLIAALSLPVGAETKPGQGDLRGHGGPVKSVATSPDGVGIVSGSFDYSMMYWDVADAVKPAMLKRFSDHDGAVNAVVILPDGGHAVTGSDDGMVRLLDLQSGAVEHIFKGHDLKVVALAVSPDGKLLVSASWDRTVRLWSLPEKRLLHVLKGHRNTVNAAVFSTDGEFVYSTGTDATIRKWRVSDGAEERVIYRNGWGINVLAALPGGRELAFGALNGTAAVLDIESGEIAHQLAQRERPILSVAVSPEHQVLAFGGGDGIVSVYDMTDWTPVKLLDNPYGPIWALTFSGDGDTLYLGGLDDTVHYWQFRPGRDFEPARGKFPRRFQADEGLSVGERQFARKCSVCHTLSPDDANRAGPTLYGVFGRKAGTLPGYAYSRALLDSDIVWNADTIGKLFEKGPQHLVPGTKMPLQKMSNTEERDAMIEWLKEKTQSSSDGATK